MPTVTQVGNSSNSYTSSSIELDEFLPIVRFNDPSHYVVEGEELVQSEENAELSKYLDKDNTEFKILELTTAKSKLKLPFTIKQGKGKKGSWFQDKDGFIEVKPSNEDEKVKIIGISKNKQTLKEGSKIFVKYNDTLEVELEITDEESKEFYLDFYANDDDNDYMKGDYENVHCGRVKVEFKVPNEWEFTKDKIDLVKQYAVSNNAKYRGAGDSNRYHHCTDTHKYVALKLLDNPTELILGKDQNHEATRNTPKDFERAGESTTDGVRNKLITSTYAENSKIFIVLDINNNEVLNSNGTAGNTDKQLSAFKESPVDYMKNKCPDNGYYVFIGAYNDDYHSFTIIVKKENGDFNFGFIDQMVGIKYFEGTNLENSKFLQNIKNYKFNFPMQLELYQLRNKKK